MLSITYVSRQTPWTESRREILENIQTASIARNSELNITGLLIATRSHFAQVLEGPTGAVDQVMASITIDPRHCEVVVLRREEIEIRRFASWQLAVFEREAFASISMRPLLAAVHEGTDEAAQGKFFRLIDDIANYATGT
jgi:hypothetical protein